MNKKCAEFFGTVPFVMVGLLPQFPYKLLHYILNYLKNLICLDDISFQNELTFTCNMTLMYYPCFRSVTMCLYFMICRYSGNTQ